MCLFSPMGGGGFFFFLETKRTLWKLAKNDKNRSHVTVGHCKCKWEGGIELQTWFVSSSGEICHKCGH